MKAFHIFLAMAAVAALGVLSGAIDPVSTGALGVVTAMAIQTAYGTTMPVGAAGMIANMNTYTADTRICETEAGLGFGIAVSRGSTDRGVVIGGATKFAGLTVRDTTLMNTTADKYADGQNVTVMFRGDMWVSVAAAVVAGGDVTFSTTTGRLSTIAADGSNIAITGAVWLDTQATVDGLARVRLSGHLPVG